MMSVCVCVCVTDNMSTKNSTDPFHIFYIRSHIYSDFSMFFFLNGTELLTLCNIKLQFKNRDFYTVQLSKKGLQQDTCTLTISINDESN